MARTVGIQRRRQKERAGQGGRAVGHPARSVHPPPCPGHVRDRLPRWGAERTVRAWGRSPRRRQRDGEREALEYLNREVGLLCLDECLIPLKERTSLTGIDLSVAKGQPGSFLNGVDLSEADFAQANLVGAVLVGADLTGARLIGANLRGADLTGARLPSPTSPAPGSSAPTSPAPTSPPPTSQTLMPDGGCGPRLQSVRGLSLARREEPRSRPAEWSRAAGRHPRHPTRCPMTAIIEHRGGQGGNSPPTGRGMTAWRAPQGRDPNRTLHRGLIAAAPRIRQTPRRPRISGVFSD